MIESLISSVLVFFLSLFTFAPNHVTTQPSNQMSILFAGDVMLGRSVMGEILDSNDYLYPFRKTSSYLTDADITFVNLENAIIANCPRQGRGSFMFCTTYEIAQGLKESGIDIVSLANNHSGNYGDEGLVETKKHLTDLGIEWVDGSNLEIIEKNGVKYGFLGFDYVYKTFSESDLNLVRDSDSKVDFLIVTPHWGEEYKAVANNFQVTTAHKMIDMGADIIVGHHPHWVQNYEEYNGKPIYYSLGNFVFDQMWSEETKKGLLVKVTFDDGKLVSKQELKTYIPNIGQPEIVN